MRPSDKAVRPGAFSFSLKKGHRRGRAHFVAAALPKTSICAPELGDKTSLPGFLRGTPAGLRRARTFSATAPPVRSGGSRRVQREVRLYFPAHNCHGLSPASENGIVRFPLCRFRSVVGTIVFEPNTCQALVPVMLLRSHIKERKRLHYKIFCRTKCNRGMDAILTTSFLSRARRTLETRALPALPLPAQPPPVSLPMTHTTRVPRAGPRRTRAGLAACALTLLSLACALSRASGARTLRSSPSVHATTGAS